MTSTFRTSCHDTKAGPNTKGVSSDYLSEEGQCSAASGSGTPRRRCPQEDGLVILVRGRVGAAVLHVDALDARVQEGAPTRVPGVGTGEVPQLAHDGSGSVRVPSGGPVADSVSRYRLKTPVPSKTRLYTTSAKTSDLGFRGYLSHRPLRVKDQASAAEE